jgi:peptidyl-tRNA hydrolase, PTH2 family
MFAIQVVLVVARALGMSAGKVGAQCAHAAVGLYRQLAVRRAPWLRAWEVRSCFFLQIRDSSSCKLKGHCCKEQVEEALLIPVYTCTQESGEKTVVLGAEGSDQLLELEQRADAASLQSYAVHDAGRTEVAAGSLTVLGIGGFSDMVDTVTGHLRTL